MSQVVPLSWKNAGQKQRTLHCGDHQGPKMPHTLTTLPTHQDTIVHTHPVHGPIGPNLDLHDTHTYGTDTHTHSCGPVPKPTCSSAHARRHAGTQTCSCITRAHRMHAGPPKAQEGGGLEREVHTAPRSGLPHAETDGFWKASGKVPHCTTMYLYLTIETVLAVKVLIKPSS